MLLTTQYLEEADRFADTVHVLHHGKVIASGTPGQLKSLAGEGSSLDDAFLALTRGAGAGAGAARGRAEPAHQPAPGTARSRHAGGGFMTTVTVHCRPARDSALIAGRNLRVLRKNPGRMIYPLVQPLVLLVMFVSVFGNLAVTVHAAGASGTYREFLIPGIIIENAALTAPTTGLALLRDASSGLADRFRSLPMARAAVLAGRLASERGRLRRPGGPAPRPRVAARLSRAARAGRPCRDHGRHGGLRRRRRRAFRLARAADQRPGDGRAGAVLPRDRARVHQLSLRAGRLPGRWMQPVARVNPVTAAAAVIRAVASGGALAAPLLELGCWTAALIVVPGALAARRWQAAR